MQLSVGVLELQLPEGTHAPGFGAALEGALTEAIPSHGLRIEVGRLVVRFEAGASPVEAGPAVGREVAHRLSALHPGTRP